MTAVAVAQPLSDLKKIETTVIKKFLNIYMFQC